MILRIFVVKWLSLSCTLNKFLTYSEKSSSCRDAKKRFSLFNLMFLMDLDRSSRWVCGTRLFSYHGLWIYEAKLRKITYITLFLDYNDRSKVWTAKAWAIRPVSINKSSKFDSFNWWSLPLMKLISIRKLPSMGKFIRIFIFYSFTVICYCIHSHTKIIFVWPGCILKFPQNTYFPEHPVILFFLACAIKYDLQIELIMSWNRLKYTYFFIRNPFIRN